MSAHQQNFDKYLTSKIKKPVSQHEVFTVFVSSSKFAKPLK